MRKESAILTRIGIWVVAARPRTLALALASVGMGAFLAAGAGAYSWSIVILTFLTATLLQILSNLANDYGDSVHGADHKGRAGPARAVQSGAITAKTMRSVIIATAILTTICGLVLLWLAFGLDGILISLLFSFLGALSIWAAISYTSGSLPYGYAGLGDLAVFVFFGWLGVLGSYYLQVKSLEFALFLPASSVGLFTVAVLNVNNIRDIESDKAAGKMSIPVRLGLKGARLYHWSLLSGGFLFAVGYVILEYSSAWQWLFVISLPLLLQNGRAVSSRPPEKLDPYLRQMSLATLLFVLTFGIGQLLGAS